MAHRIIGKAALAMGVLALVGVAGFFAGCGPKGEAATPDDEAPSRLPEAMLCYAGETALMTPDGTSVGAMGEWVKRTERPSDGIITEAVLRTDPRPEVPPAEYILTFEVSGSTYSFEEPSGAFRGEGELLGDPWKWSGWRSTSTLPDGSTLTSEDKRTAEGLHADKVMKSADGVVRMKFTTDLHAIPCDEYDAKRAELLVPAGAGAESAPAD